MCDRIGIFAAGRLVGQGSVEELATAFGDGTATIEVGLELPTPDDVGRAGTVLGALKGVTAVNPPIDGRASWQLVVRPAGDEGRVRQEILVAAVQHDLRLTTLRPIVPSLDDIYRAAVVRTAA